MKELSKVKLQGAEVLDEEEMKLITGGYGVDGPYYFCCNGEDVKGPFQGSGFCPDNTWQC